MPEIELHAQQWLHHQQGAAYLLRGKALSDILTTYIKTSDRLSPLCHEFITACLDERDKQQKLAKRRIRGFWVGGWILALILTGMGLWQGQKMLLDYLLSDIDAIAHWEKSSKADLDWQSQDRLIKDWNKQEFLQEYTERDRLDGITDIEISPDGNFLAYSNTTKKIVLWDRRQSNFEFSEHQFISGHTDWIRDIAFSPDGKIIASASDDRTIKLWNRQGKLLHTLNGHTDWVRRIEFSPDGKILASYSDDRTIRLWNLEGKLLQTFTHSDYIHDLAFTPDGQAIATGNEKGVISFWTLQGKLIRRITAHSADVKDLDFSPNGQMLASAGEDGTIKLWNKDGKLLKTIRDRQLPEDKYTRIKFNRDGQTLVSASESKNVKIWDIHGKRYLCLLTRVTDVKFTPDGNYFFYGGWFRLMGWQSLDKPGIKDDFELLSWKIPLCSREDFAGEKKMTNCDQRYH
ncbi:WD40 repeat-containing protein (plasmid) [Stanieria cyanosphaera PCC 7437]|uniref:WD40 repeat-containing protein n=1 Tax=Stanieria cyanosphaera (strain ATCC 29371 / PCC 7437) TaxID=111780 RepID=K9Y0B5_STAC7|nr:WD40 repeat domain-containing protein [Stanieria cyanosphaera]AFZ38270.1 WD40 repeat-containing protein [Stanieria cyanosphaera PCC 7437]